MSNLKKSVSIAMGATFAASMAASPVANADENPFSIQNLESGYMQLAEAKCGEDRKKTKDQEAKCGENKKKTSDQDTKDQEAKCGEAKCGEDKNGDS
ncbi:MAG: low-complexity protein [Gammaproteobacteria bacterium]|nr:low-complexity protein [Gammaproteobacteria bacterium]